jgi:hypothetical protein
VKSVAETRRARVSKKYKGRLCIYCAKATSTTADHVVAKEFFLEHRRRNLPKAPSCEPCNNEKSRLEHYLTTVLPFGGRHPDALPNLAKMVPKRLEHNLRLRAELAAGIDAREGNLNSAEMSVQPTTITIDGDRFERLFAMIAQGLAWYHWGIIVREGCSIKVATISDAYVPFVDHLFSMRSRDRVEENLSNTFYYEGVQAVDCADLTLWRMTMYGVCFKAASLGSDLSATLILAMTGPDEGIGKVWPTLIGKQA